MYLLSPADKVHSKKNLLNRPLCLHIYSHIICNRWHNTNRKQNRMDSQSRVVASLVSKNDTAGSRKTLYVNSGVSGVWTRVHRVLHEWYLPVSLRYRVCLWLDNGRHCGRGWRTQRAAGSLTASPSNGPPSNTPPPCCTLVIYILPGLCPWYMGVTPTNMLVLKDIQTVSGFVTYLVNQRKYCFKQQTLCETM